jgi:hypothetical protein
MYPSLPHMPIGPLHFCDRIERYRRSLMQRFRYLMSTSEKHAILVPYNIPLFGAAPPIHCPLAASSRIILCACVHGITRNMNVNPLPSIRKISSTATRMLVNGSSLSAVYKVRELIWIDYETFFWSHHHLAIYLLAYLLEFSNKYTNLYPAWASGMSKVGELHCVVRVNNKCLSYRNNSLSYH